MNTDTIIQALRKEFEKVNREHTLMMERFQQVNQQHDTMLSSFTHVEKEHQAMGRELADIKALLTSILDRLDTK